MQIWTVFETVYHVACRGVFWNENILHISVTEYFGVRIFVNT